MASGDYIPCTIWVKSDRTVHFQSKAYRRRSEAKLHDDELVVQTIERLSSWVARNEQVEQEDLALLGRHLYRLLFQGDVKKDFEDTYGQFEDQYKRQQSLRLRITLAFDQNAPAARYPWEFLYMPSGNDGVFLAGQLSQLILARFVPPQDDDQEDDLIGGLEDDMPADEELRVLVAFAHPQELGEIDAADVIQVITALKKHGVDVKPLDNPRYEELQAEINAYKPHVFHFIGHGQPGAIALIRPQREIEDEANLTGNVLEARWCSVKEVKALFAAHKPHLVFLHACKGGESFVATLESFTSTARDLVYDDIPAVIGMQYAIDNEPAAMFATAFYQALADGRPIDEAVTLGRTVLGTFNGYFADRRFATPLLYVQRRGAIALVPPGRNGNGGPTCPYGCGWTFKREALGGYRNCPGCHNPVTLCPNGHLTAVVVSCVTCGVKLPAAGAEASASAAAEPRGTAGASTPVRGDGSFE